MEEKDEVDSSRGNFISVGTQTQLDEDAEEDEDNEEFTCNTLDLIERELQDYQVASEGHQKSRVCCEQATHLVQKLTKIIDDFKGSKKLQSEDPVQKALLNSVIVRKILGFLPSRDLFSCRRVCTLWAEESTSLFLSSAEHEEFLEVKFTWTDCDSDSDSGAEAKYEHDFMGSLEDFTRDFFCCEKFPCSQFSFIGGDLHDKNLIQFFEKYGHRVKFLSLKPQTQTQTQNNNAELDEFESNNNTESLKIFYRLVFNLARNLKYLELRSTKWMEIIVENDDFSLSKLFSKEEEEAKVEPKNQRIILPHLKILRLPSDDNEDFGGKIIEMILKSAVNLTHIFDPCLNYSGEIVSSGKFHLIDSLILRLIDLYPPNSARLLRFINSFSQSQSNERPRLKSIHFDPFSGEQRLVNLDPRVIHAISWIFTISQETLENLKGIETLSIIPNLQLELPQLRNVKSLSLENELYEREILPCGRDENQELSFILPELEHLKLEWISMENNPLESNLNSHLNVKQLDLFSKCPAWRNSRDSQIFPPGGADLDADSGFGFGFGFVQPGWITRAGKLYPNVEKLCITIRCKNQDTPKILKSIWSAFQNLEFLSITFCLHLKNARGKEKWKNSTTFPSKMDEAFTGFSLKLCKNLRRDLKYEDEFQMEETVEKWRENPSICDLKRLKTLEISGASPKESRKYLWSHVTEYFAFQPLINRGVILKIH